MLERQQKEGKKGGRFPSPTVCASDPAPACSRSTGSRLRSRLICGSAVSDQVTPCLGDIPRNKLGEVSRSERRGKVLLLPPGQQEGACCHLWQHTCNQMSRNCWQSRGVSRATPRATPYKCCCSTSWAGNAAMRCVDQDQLLRY